MTDGDHETQTRIAKLEQEVSSLRRKLDRMFAGVDIATKTEPFLWLMLSLDTTEAQESAVYDLMNEVDAQASTQQPGIPHVEFGEPVSKILPTQRARQHLAEAHRDPSGAGRRMGSGLSAPASQRHESQRHSRSTGLLTGWHDPTVRAASSVVEHLTFNQMVAGSIPARPTIKDRVESTCSVQPVSLFGHYVVGLWPFCKQLSAARPSESVVQPDTEGL